MELYSKILKNFLKYLMLSIPFNDEILRFLVSAKWVPQIFRNLDHVLVSCDYFRVMYAIPRRGYTVLDVGAFVGFYTIAASYLVGKEGRVYAIEPNPEAVTLLIANIKLNNVNNVKLYPIAVSNKSGVSELHVGHYGAVSSLISEHTLRYSGIEKVYKVKCITLSTLLRYIGAVDVLKIDIEGLEDQVLREAKEELWRVRSIVVEIHSNIADLHDIESLLYEAGFTKLVMYTTSDMPEQIIVYGIRG